MNITAILKKNTGMVIFILLAFAFFLSSCATTAKRDTASVVKTMIRFDQAFIPALAMTSKGDPEGSEKAMNILLSEWSVLKPELSAFFPNDKVVQDNITTVDRIIHDAAGKLTGGAELLEVHEILEMVKKPFVEIRAEKHISYYPDLLDAYHTVMEEILSITAGKSVSDITPQNMKMINDLAVKGVDQWTVIKRAGFDSELFGFNENKTANLMKSVKSGREEGIKFVSIVESGNIGAMLTEAATLKSYYTKVYLQFGNFARLK